jgi:outer membrane protein insertion porin family
MNLRCNLLKIYYLVLAATFWPGLSAAELIVEKVEVRIHGADTVSTSVAASRIKIKEGEPFLQELNDDSIRALYATHLFDLVEVFTENGARDGHIDVVYVLHPKRRLDNISFSGNKRVSTKKLRNTIAIKSGSLLNQTQVQKDVDAILEFYRVKGYPDVSVSTSYSNSGDRCVDLSYEIFEGSRMPIEAINFVGNHTVKTEELRKKITMRRRGFLSFLNKSGTYRPRQFDDDLEILRAYYKHLGFLDVIISKEDVRFERCEGKSLTITINVAEGPRFRVGNIAFSGNNIYDSDKFAKFMQIHEGEYFSPEKIDNSIDAIRRLYGRDGHIETAIFTQLRDGEGENVIDINFVIKESAVSRVGLVHLQGNTKTKNKVILRELSIFPGDVFNLSKLRNSENRLRETQYFERVSIMPESRDEDNTLDVLVSVNEGKTGKMIFGGAISSIDNIVGCIEFSQANCDFFNRRAHFQGAGQKFRTHFEMGTRSAQALISFEDPWLCNRELAFGSDIFFSRNEYRKSDHNYDGASYNERHAGFESHLRKRIAELLECHAYYRLDRTRIYDVDPCAPFMLQQQGKAGAKLISKVGVLLTRDSRDSLLYPTIGNRSIFSAGYAGLGGDIHYVDFDFQTGQWIRIKKSLIHSKTFAIVGKAGTMKKFKSEPIPYFDRKFLGGTTEMRGFEVHAVGPHFGGPVGAQSYVYGCAEYCTQLSNILRVAFFGEIAKVGVGFAELQKPIYADAGIELRLFVMGSPLRLIFGYPFRGDKFYKHKLQFNFTFGQRYKYYLGVHRKCRQQRTHKIQVIFLQCA